MNVIPYHSFNKKHEIKEKSMFFNISLKYIFKYSKMDSSLK